eukprot:gnl/Chilomastix_cuspidata/2016.p1 GENE.gnl/Chilomastix_cuspidata/2016~~gnl/Chilomastix_cuspidata/2016.p1  ORF type:complete len:844 (-),score=-24.08 gnl/Chilomastix_cuspidata/2016:432-2963(-)
MPWNKVSLVARTSLLRRAGAWRARGNYFGVSCRQIMQFMSGAARTEISFVEDVVLSVFWRVGYLGIAYHSMADNTLCLAQVPEADSDFACLALVKYQIRPDAILVPSVTSEALIQSCKQPNVFDEPEQPAVRLSFLSSSDYNYENSLQRLETVISSVVGKSEKNGASSGKGMIDLSRRQMVRACGALLSHLSKRSTRPNISQVKMVHIPGVLSLQDETLSELGVFSSEAHPIAGLGQDREGFSLFSLLNRAKSEIGTRCIKMWLRRPMLDIDTLMTRHELVKWGTGIGSYEDEENGFDNISQREAIRDALKGLCDPRPILTKMREGPCIVAQWKRLEKCLLAIKNVHNIIFARLNGKPVSSHPIIRACYNAFDEKCAYCLQLIQRVVDTGNLAKSDGFPSVKEGISRPLDELRKSMGNLEATLTEVASCVLADIPQEFPIESLSVVFLPQIGYLVAIPVVNNGKLDRIPSWLEPLFSTSEFAYAKSPHTRALDEKLGDLHRRIVDLTQAVLREARDRICSPDVSTSIIVASHTIAELDAIFALSSAAEEFNWTASPKLTIDFGKEREIKVSQGRHPFLELLLPNYVPFDIKLDNSLATLIVTGPNSSGKSVFLQAVGLLVLLSHIGSLVPAESIELSIVDGILTQTRSTDSSSISQSAFTRDASHAALLMRKTTERTLVLIDEFGKGTASLDGAALFVSLVRWLGGGFQSPRPRALITTNMSLPFHPASGLNEMRSRVSVVQMSFTDEAHPLYTISDGKNERSYAVVCAKRAGMPEDVCKRAENVMEAFSEGMTPEIGAEAAEKKKKLLNLVDKFEKLDSSSLNFVNEIKRIVQEYKDSYAKF